MDSDTQVMSGPKSNSYPNFCRIKYPDTNSCGYRYNLYEFGYDTVLILESVIDTNNYLYSYIFQKFWISDNHISPRVRTAIELHIWISLQSSPNSYFMSLIVFLENELETNSHVIHIQLNRTRGNKHKNNDLFNSVSKRANSFTLNQIKLWYNEKSEIIQRYRSLEKNYQINLPNYIGILSCFYFLIEK